MKTTVAVTRKGQTTLPAIVRSTLGISKDGGNVFLELNEQTGEVRLTRPVSIEDLSARISSFIKPGTAAITDVDSYYQQHRKSQA